MSDVARRLGAHRPHALLARLLVAAGLIVLATPVLAGASTPSSTRDLIYHGYHVRVPRSWPVYNLAAHPSTCVRFNRHAVYLGSPGASQACPPASIGRTEAILVQPGTGHGLQGMDVAGVAREIKRGLDVTVTATWNRDPSVIQHALGLASRRALNAAAPLPASPPRTPALSARTAVVTGGASTPGQIFTGRGFDVCSTPSTANMAAWTSSPYDAVGVYIGGANRACSQPNLTSSWTYTESAAGWHIIPIYVGLQAPSNGCGCAAIRSSSAASEGTAAATDAVLQAQTIGLGVGNPLYFDMEGYSRTSANTTAVMNFLAAWTQQLHAEGYLSGVYSSDGSGIADLVARWGTTFPEPDELWFAAWNGSASTTDSTIPSGEWANHQRLHQYTGGVNQTYAGVTMNIDQDYLDSSTAAYGSGASSAAAPPVSTVLPTATGYAFTGQTLGERHGGWTGSPSSYSYQWYRCDAAGASCAPIAGAGTQTYAVQSGDLGHTLRVAETAHNAVGASSPAASPQTAVVQPAPTSSYWLFTAYGNVYNALGSPFFGSESRARTTTIRGMARTPDRRGYWLVNATGHVYHLGDAAPVAGVRVSAKRPVIGIVGAPGGGYYLYNAHGNVWQRGGATFYGSPRAQHIRDSGIRGMAVTSDGRGYWIVDRSGRVFAYGDAAKLPAVRSRYAIRGIVTGPSGGYWLWTAHGNVFNVGNATFYSSPFGQGVRTGTFTGMVATSDRRGYWLVESSGQVWQYGNAEALPQIRPAHPAIGMAG